MKKTARILCLVLSVIMLLLCASACAKDPDYGAYINMYLSSEVYNFDPAYAHLDSSAAKLIGLLYEGLFTLDDKDNVKKALCDSWTYKEDKGINKESADDDVYEMTIFLKDSAWTDNRMVTADEFVFAWKRLLSNDFDGEGAHLLFDIKGAWEAKNEGASPDDIGLFADKKVLRIQFAHPINPDDFIRKLTSIALLPVRTSSVDHYYNWSSSSSTIVTNGPFSILSYVPGDRLLLTRNTYYRHDVTSDKSANATRDVRPHQIFIDYKLNATEIMANFEEGQLFYISEIPASKEIRELYEKRVKLSDTLSSHVYYLNTTIAPFDNPVVRKALSDIIDRAAIVDEVVYAKPATGFVPSKIQDTISKTSFAAANNAKLASEAKALNEVKSALSAAGIDPSSYGTLYITVKTNASATPNDATGAVTWNDKLSDSNDGVVNPTSKTPMDVIENTTDVVVAKMVAEMWNSLGFDFQIRYVNADDYREATSLLQFRDILVEDMYGTYGKGIIELVDEETNERNTITKPRQNFDVIAADYTVLDSTAFSALAIYAANFSGARLDDTLDNSLGHISGYNDSAYNGLIMEAYEAYKSGDKALLSQKLHEAEEKLINDMPIIPIFEYQNASLTGAKLSGVKYSSLGFANFNSANLRNWKDYLPEE